MQYSVSLRSVLLPLLLLAGTIASWAVSAADESRVHKDIEFASVEGHSLQLDVYLPAASNPPLVVWIHGGGWRAGSKERCPVTWLTEHGYAVASISYRLTDRAVFPAQIHDCKAAVRWLRASAGRFGYRTDRIAVAGSSAGGHLAALLGTSGDVKELEGDVGGHLEQPSRVAAVVDFYGATDFVLRSKTQPHRANDEGSVVYRLLGGGADQQVELARQASAAFHVTPDDPPFLVLHGDEDQTVLLDQSQRIEQVYRDAQLPLTLHILKGSGHGGDEFYSGRQREIVVEFLDEQLKRSQTDYTPAVARLQAAVRHEVEQKQLPAFSISLVDRDRVVWADGFGFQDAAKKVPAGAETVYRVGSVSKLFTDIAVLQLVEGGKLDLDAPVQNYLPDFRPGNPYDIPLTLRQMMSHRSGLVRESPVGHYFDPDEPTLDATVASLNNTSLVYRPETKTKYSNAAIAVVGAILERQLDVSHPERVRQAILDPLGMDGSSFVITPAVEPRLATGWMRTYDGRRFEAPAFLLGTGPAGNLYSNVLDLSKFLSCLFDDGRAAGGQILRPESLALMATPVKDSDGVPQGFGLGFHVQKLDGYAKIGHGGAVYGFSTQLEALPERKLGVATASSLDGTNGVVGRLADYALRLMIATQDGKPLPTFRTTGPIPPERARDLIGKYREVDGQRFTRITEFSGDVFMQRGSFRYELRAAADDGVIITDDEIDFGTKVQLRGDGRLLVGDTVFQRLPDEPPAGIPDRWRGLIGEYGWDHNTLYILEEDGRLYALIEWFYYYPLKELGDDVFEFPDYGLYHGEGLKFTRDARGVATEVTAAEVRFARREVGTKDGETFRITPVRPIDQLRAAALAASPPAEPGEYRDSELIELVTLDPTIRLDIRYATTNNFTGAVFYKQPKAFMQVPAAEAVARANQRLKPRGLGLLVHDAYRPWHVTKMFWDATPDDLKDFVANPANGSRHNRGCAVDLTLYDLASGRSIQMVAGYDEFSPRSFPQYPGGTSRQRWYRELLRGTMESEGFTVYEYEWWHFDYQDWQAYRIENATFEELGN